MRVANALFFVAYLASVAVQFNDPDPLRWITIYAAAALCCVLWERRWGPPSAPAFIAGIALLWSAGLLVAIPADVDLAGSVTQWQMKVDGSELVREVGGLWFVAVWMAALFWRPRDR